jgi:hypothetical protein
MIQLPKVVYKEDQYVLNHCTKYLSRDQGEISDAWRFPILDSYSDGVNFLDCYQHNEVTFVYDGRPGGAPREVAVLGTFASLYSPIPLKPVEFLGQETGLWSATVIVSKGQIHTYKFLVDGQIVLDPINPQQTTLENGATWSRFFTHNCTQPINFERWEYSILFRLTEHILPFRTKEGQEFLKRHYFDLDRKTKETQFTHAYRLDNSVGVINYIDNILAREENHRLLDYKLCLHQIDRVLRRRNPYVEPEVMTREMYVELYEQMATNAVEGWDYKKYSAPRFFLQLLRRHTLTGAFSHPKYGGNSAAMGWAYLSEKYTDDTGQTLFDWRQAIEAPIGLSREYRG